MMPEGQRPHPRRSYRGRGCLHDPPDDYAIGKHVEVIFIRRMGGLLWRA
jgi:hypothetical protein